MGLLGLVVKVKVGVKVIVNITYYVRVMVKAEVCMG